MCTITGGMAGFLRSLLTKVSGVKLPKNKVFSIFFALLFCSFQHPVNHIEGADTVLVDSSIFCCPVCYNVYASVCSSILLL